jgi:WD40 repeat protein/tRNA A-37 threonylcarbamoyl transferase component Bud32
MEKDKKAEQEADSLDLEEGLQKLFEAQPSQAPPSENKVSSAILPKISPDNYSVGSEFARGGLGRIIRALDKRLKRTVAIKELISDQKETRERFLREARITARLQHPGIVPVYEAGCWPSGEPFYSMKLVSGSPLHELIHECNMLDERLALIPSVLAAAEAIAYAHSKQIIHRDLKPHNILIGEFGETVVIDWGLAKELERSDHTQVDRPPNMTAQEVTEENGALTLDGSVIGTPAYMPPEQARGEPLDERADVYALGAILYHLLSGEPPYQEKSAPEILRLVVKEPPTSLKKKQSGIPQDLLDLVQKAMSRDPSRRYPNAKALAEDLKKFLSGQLISAHQYPTRERVVRFIQQHKTSVLIAAFSLLTIALILGFSLQQILTAKNDAIEKQHDEERARKEATARADSLLIEQARALVQTEPERALYLLSMLSSDFSGWSTARLIAANANAYPMPTFLQGHTQDILYSAISRDGARLASVGQAGELILWNVAKETHQKIQLGVTPEPASRNTISFQLSPDERLLALSTKEKSILLIDFESGAIKNTLTAHTNPIHKATFSPKGKWLASASIPSELFLWDVDSGASRSFTQSQGDLMLSMAFSPDERWLAATYQSGLIELWDLEAKESKRQLTASHGSAHGVSFSSDSSMLAITSQDASVTLFHLVTGEQIDLQSDKKSADLSTQFSPDGSRLISFSNYGDEARSIRVWELSTRSAKTIFTDGTTLRVSFLPSSEGAVERLITLSAKEEQEQYHIQKWDLAQEKAQSLLQTTRLPAWVLSQDSLYVSAGVGKTLRYWRLSLKDEGVLSFRKGGRVEVPVQLQFSPDGEWLALATAAETDDPGDVWLWEMRSKRATRLPLDVSFGVGIAQSRHMQFSRDSKQLAIASLDKNVHLISLDTLTTNKLPMEEEAEVLAFSPVEDLLVIGGATGTLALWDLSQNALLSSLPRTNTGVVDIAFSPSGDWVAASTRGDSLAASVSQSEILLWNVRSGELRHLRSHTLPALGLTFSADSSTLFSCGIDHTVQQWSLAKNTNTKIFTPGQCNWLALSPSQDVVAVSGAFSSLMLWGWKTQTQTLLRGHLIATAEIQFSSSGDTLLSASPDTTVRLWDMATQESRIIGRHRDQVFLVKFSPDEKMIASVSLDGEVRLWSDDLPREPAALRAWLKSHAPTHVQLGE